MLITFSYYAGADVIFFLPETQFFNYFRSPNSVFAFGAVEAIVFSFALADKYDMMQKDITRVKIEKEQEKSEQLRKINIASSKFVPSPFLNFLGKENILEATLGDYVEKQVNVLFSDIRVYTSLSENMTPEDNFKFVNAFNLRMGPIIRNNKGFINQYLGDGIMAIFPEDTEDTLNAAIEMHKNLNEYNQRRLAKLKIPIRMGIGIHTGPLIMGIIGDEQRMDAATISDTVNVASRIEGLTKHFGASILVSEACVQNLKHKEKFNLRYLGLTKVKGKREEIKIYECFDGETQEIIELKRATLKDFEVASQLYFDKSLEQSLSIFKNIVEINPKDFAAKIFLDKVDESLKTK